MLSEQTIHKLNTMKLFGMARSYDERRGSPEHADLSHDEFTGLIVDDEYQYRQNRRLSRLLVIAKLKISTACLEDVDYRHPRGLIKTVFVNLHKTDWIDNHHNILITGPTGAGKTYLACALGQFACRNVRTTRYFRWPRLFGDLMASRADGTYLKRLHALSKVDVLIIDDFGLNTLSDFDRKDFLEVIEDRYLSRSTIITSQLPLKNWHEYIGDSTVADAICDRLFHIAHKFELKGGSMRQNKKCD